MKIAKIILAAAVAAGTLFAVTGCGKNTKQKELDGVKQLKNICLYCKMYSGDHGDKFPDDFTQLSDYFLDSQDFISPWDSKRTPSSNKIILQKNTSYVYVGKGMTEKFSPKCPIAFEKPDLLHKGTTNVVCMDGSVGNFKLPEIPKTSKEFAEMYFASGHGKGIPENEKMIVLANAAAFDANME